MKIVMLVLNNITYDARVHKQAKSLSLAGNAVTVIGLLDEVSTQSETIQSGYQILRLEIRSMKGRYSALSQLIRLIEFNVRAVLAIINLHPRVVHAHAIQTLPACWLGARLSRGRLVYDAHEFEQGQDFSAAARIPRLMQWMWIWPEKLFIRSADSVITVSDSLADALKKTYQIDKPVVIRNIPEHSSYVSFNQHKIMNLYDIPPGWPIILYQGIFSTGRGLLELIQSAAYLQSTALLFVGDGSLLKDMQLTSHKISSNVRFIFLGRVSMEDLPAITSQAHIGMVLTQNTCLNHYYSLPNKLFEYLQAGLPVIGSNLPEISRIIDENQAGILVDPDDPQDIARGIKQLLDPQVYMTYKINALLVASNYNWENESAKLIKLYQHLGQSINA
jgi:glycosyltransferase involved in cell wall biosynthesis